MRRIDMCRDKENDVNEKMTDTVLGKECSDEQAGEETEGKRLKIVTDSEDSEKIKASEEHTVVAEMEELDKEELSEVNCQQDDEQIVLPQTIFPEPSYAFFNNISVFAFSQQGESHIKNDIPCQDRSGFKVIEDKIVITAIADGVGSCALSDDGAEVAVESALAFLEEYFINELKQESFEVDDPAKMGKALRAMMRFAFENVEKRAVELQQLSYSFQSTLTVAAYDGYTLYFAHAGDDGIVALNKMGTYALVTSRHKGEEASSVYPLQSQNTWQFGKVNDTVAFVMATDGVLDAFVGSLSENNRVYYPFIEPVFYNSQLNKKEAKQACYDWYEYMKSSSYRARVTDDLSFVGVVNQETIKTSVKPEFESDKWEQQTKEYQEKRKAALYPQKSEIKSEREAKKSILENTIKNKDVSVESKSTMCSTSESIKQAREAAKKVNEGVKELAVASAAIIIKGVGRATSHLAENMEQVSEEVKKNQE